MKIMLPYLSITLATVLVSSGCISIGEDYRRPDLGIEMPRTYQHVPAGAVMLRYEDYKDKWWQVFGDSELDRWVEEVVRNNLDIKKATARILELQSRFVQTRADRFPTLDLDGKSQRQQQQETISVPGFSLKFDTETHNLSLPASFELDLWGRLAWAEEAARADILEAEEARRTVAQTVVAETVTLYLRMESLERRIQITKQSIKNYHRSLKLVESRYRQGLTSVLDLRQARRTLAEAESFLPSLCQELGITQQKLAVLLGRYPRTRPPRLQPEEYYERLTPVPAHLPSELLLRRPDIRAAEAKLRALNALMGVAEAGRFPRIRLTGNLGYSSAELGRLFRPPNEFWNLAFGIMQPLFDAGKLKSIQSAAEARYQQGVAEYAKTVLTAFSEVEGALLIRKEQLARRRGTLNTLREARAMQEVVENRYQRGLVDYFIVLESQQTRFKAEEDLVLVDLAILSNRVSFHRALGGGWADPAPFPGQRTPLKKNFLNRSHTQEKG